MEFNDKVEYKFGILKDKYDVIECNFPFQSKEFSKTLSHFSTESFCCMVNQKICQLQD